MLVVLGSSKNLSARPRSSAKSVRCNFIFKRKIQRELQVLDSRGFVRDRPGGQAPKIPQCGTYRPMGGAGPATPHLKPPLLWKKGAGRWWRQISRGQRQLHEKILDPESAINQMLDWLSLWGTSKPRGVQGPQNASTSFLEPLQILDSD